MSYIYITDLWVYHIIYTREFRSTHTDVNKRKKWIMRVCCCVGRSVALHIYHTFEALVLREHMHMPWKCVYPLLLNRRSRQRQSTTTSAATAAVTIRLRSHHMCVLVVRMAFVCLYSIHVCWPVYARVRIPTNISLQHQPCVQTQ